MECLSQELRRERSTREPLEGSQRTLELEDRPTDAALWLIELDIVCCTHCLEGLWDMIAYSLSNTLPLI
jgi:hypothetical protein